MRTSALAPEVQLLFMLLDRGADEEALAAVIEGGIDWRYFNWLVQRERAAPVARQRLVGVPADIIPEPVQSSLARLAMVTEFRMLRLSQRLDETLEAFRVAGIEVILLKGAALASTVYPRFSARPMGDLDLLVRAERGAEAWEVARRVRWRAEFGKEFDQFYSEHQHYPPLEDEDGTDLGLDLHTALFTKEHPFELSVEALWAAAEPVPGQGDGVYVLSPVHQALHLCIHFAWSHIMQSASWRSFRDLRALLDTGRLDWEELAEISLASRSATAVYWTLRLARALVGLEVPESVLGRLAPSGPEMLRRLLERHYVTHITPALDQCPSVRMGWTMWEWGIRPGASGHGGSRPWSRNSIFRESAIAAAARAGEAGPAEEPSHSKFLDQLGRFRDWSRYLAVLSGRASRSPSRTAASRRAMSSKRGRSASISSERTVPSR